MVPVGYPVEDNEILLLNDDGEQLGFNDIGEIAVKSRYLSPGYWHRPDLTQAVFRPDPEGSDERTYRTGDLGHMLPDGCLVHLGRKDDQVKIRGYRVEVDEIEMVLIEHPAIKEAVVVAQADQRGDQRLVAYLVPNTQPAPTITGMRHFLAERLASYMIPSAFVTLDALPLAPNGKVNRRALPEPGSARPELEVAFVAPRTPAEALLAEIWSEVLGLDHVGVDDRFLEFGGNSLLATQIISRIINRFQVELPLRSLFEAPTVASMAVAITQNQAKQAAQEDLDRMLAELEALSDEEAQSRLAKET
jgi:acyl carrier protein